MVQSIQSEDAPRIDFGLIFFSSNEAVLDQNKYQLVIESTKFADQHGFSSVWIPERHFTRDGWLYPNPAVLQAALARETHSIHLRAGSVVLPLHNPLRVAEEWAMVDNLSNGRVGISVASGWHPNDFAFFPENYERRHEAMFENIEKIRKLWRGESIQVRAGDGRMIDVRTYPTPVQSELPIWVTAAGNPKTFATAGEIGAHLLTHMYNQDPQELAEKIRIYRQARADHGYDPATGQVAVMLHTFLHKDDETVLSQVQGPFCNYLRSASYLVNAVAYSRGQQQVDFSTLSEQDQEDYLQFVLNRLISTRRVLFGTPENCADFVQQLHAAGVDEIACQFDFGVETNLVLESLPYLDQLKDLVNQRLRTDSTAEARRPSIISSSSSALSAIPVQSEPVDENDLARVRKRCVEAVSLPDFYRTLSLHGIELSARFQGIEELYKGANEALGLIQLHASLLDEAERYRTHPTLLDACFQVLIAALPQSLIAREDALYLPTGIRHFQVFAPLLPRVWSHARLSYSPSSSPAVIEGDVRILDMQGNLIAQATGLKLQRAELSEPGAAHSHLDEWLYELAWEPVELSQQAMAEHTPATWIIFQDAGSVGLSLASLLEAQGDDYVQVEPADRYERVDARHYRLRSANQEDLLLLLSDVNGHARYPLNGLIDLWSLRTTPVVSTSAATLRADQKLGAQHALALLQADLALGSRDLPRVWLVTRSAQPVVSSQETLEIAQAPVWGLGKTCAMEHPDIWGGLVDLEFEEDEAWQARQLLSCIAAGQSENLLAFRQQRAYAARMVHRELDSELATYVPDPSASYLVTGGLWGLGLEVARWLADQGARHLVLLGRTILPPREEWERHTTDDALALRIAGIRAIERAGASVHYASVDVTNEQQLHDFLTSYERDGHPAIRGVVHAASVWQDAQGGSLVGPLVNLNMRAYATVFEPKVIGLWHLHQFLRARPLDFFVSFSSAASLFGSAAQGNYAAAGEFLDVFAHYQRAQGVPALSIDWGAISQVGFGATPEGLRVHEYWESHGIQRIAPQDVLHALAVLLRQPLARVGLVKLNWTQLYQFYPQLVASPLFSRLSEIVQATRQSGMEVASATGSQVMQLLAEALTDEQRQQVLEDYLRMQVATVLRSTPDQLDIHQPLTELGLDSLMAIELKNRLELELEVRIPIVTFLQGPTIAEFATQVRSQFLQPVIGDTQTVEKSGYTGSSTVLSAQESQQILAGQRMLQDESHTQTVLASLSSVAQEEPVAEATGETNYDLSAQDASELLSHIDQLSDEEVERLLSQLVRNED